MASSSIPAAVAAFSGPSPVAAAAAGSGAAAGGAGGGLLSNLAARLQGLLSHLIELYQSGWRFRWLTHGLLALGVAFLALRALHRRFLARYRDDLTATVCQPEYDYIVVGAGSAGAALAVRLAEQDPRLQVLLLEAGGSDDVLEVNCPAACIKLQRDARTDWQYKTEPQKSAHGNMAEERGCWPRGKLLGGCSSINYMLFVRGAPEDFDSWAAAGAGPEWNYESVLPYFKRLESVTPATSTVAPSPLRGTEGPMPCNLIISPQPSTHAFIESAVSSGILELNADYNGSSIFGVAMSQYNVAGGKRVNTSAAYVAPALKKDAPNLHVLTHAHVQRVIFNANKEAQGVALKRGTDASAMRDQPETFIRARREVIICAGAVGSPQLLELSGVGQAGLLKDLGIPLVADRPGVGENLTDHLAAPIFHESLTPTLSAADESIPNIARWLTKGDGPLTGNMVEAMAWMKTKAHAGAGIGSSMPDMQFHMLSGTIAPEDFKCFNTKQATVDSFKALMANGLKYTSAIMPTLLHPRSKGWVHCATRSALDAPKIQPNYLSEQADVDSFVEACKVSMLIYAEPAMRKVTGKFLCDVTVPNNPWSREAQPDKYWEFYVRAQANTLYHPVGTCKIGQRADPLAVVDSQLRVIGVSRLRVADASVMPHLVSGNTNVPCIMIGEKAADIIKAAREGKTEVSAPPPAQTFTKAKL